MYDIVIQNVDKMSTECIQNTPNLSTKCIQNVDSLYTQVRLGKVRLGKDNTYMCQKPTKIKENFEICWSEYPKRGGTNPKKIAYEKYKDRIKSKETYENLLQATKQYKKFCDQLDYTNSSFVMQASRFYGVHLVYKDFIDITDEEISQKFRDEKHKNQKLTQDFFNNA